MAESKPQPRTVPSEAFETWVGLGPSRSFERVAAEHGVSARAVSRAAQAEGWPARLDAIEERVRAETDERLKNRLIDERAAAFDRELKVAESVRKASDPEEVAEVLGALKRRATGMDEGGDPQAARVFLEFVIGKPRGRSVAAAALTSSPMTDSSELARGYSDVWVAVARGLLTVDEGAKLGGLLAGHGAAFERSELEARIKAMEDYVAQAASQASDDDGADGAAPSSEPEPEPEPEGDGAPAEAT